MEKTNTLTIYNIYHENDYIIAKETYKRFLVIDDNNESSNMEKTTFNINKKLLKKLDFEFDKEDFTEAEDGESERRDGKSINHLYYKDDLEEIETVDGDTLYFLDSDNIYEYDYECCDNCGLYFNRNNTGYYVEHNGCFYCSDDCLHDAGYYVCDDCGEIVPESSIAHIVDTGDDVCKDCCYNSGYGFCEECEEWYSDNNIEYDEDGDRYLCTDCYDECDCGKIIKSYHTAKDGESWDFHSTIEENNSGKKLDYMGAELEIEAKGNYSPTEIAMEIDGILNSTFRGRIAHFEHDGSLSNGVEIIFNPMTINYIYENLELFEKALAKIDELGGKSHDTKTCGLHIHYSRLHFDDSNIARLVYLFEKYKKEIIRFSRRKIEQVEHWAKFNDFDNIDYKNNLVLNEWQPITPIDYIADNLEDGDRYMAVNLTNDDTIEVRINKGTLKFSTFIACFEFVNNIMQIALNNEIEIENISFADILTYNDTKYLLDYCESKHIYNKDNTIVEGVA